MSAPASEIVLVRHGETTWSREGRHTGLTDVALTAHGRKQARELGARLAGRRFARVLTSPLRRARETCELAGVGAAAEATPDLREWDYGAYEGLTTAEIRRQRPGWTIWEGDPSAGESLAQVAARADRVVAGLRGLDGDALVVAHGHLLRVLAARWLGLEPEAGRLFALDAGSLSVLGYEHDSSVLRGWNAGVA